MQENKEMSELIESCCAELNSDLILLNAGMSAGVDDQVRLCLSQKDKLSENVIVILITEGGLADVAYRAAMVLQARYTKITICIAGWCKSAGTLLAIGGHELIMGDRGELGPLDVQVAVKDEIGDRNSGLILESAIESMRDESFKLFEEFMMGIKARSGNLVTFRTAADLASALTIGLMKPIFEQIDPIRLGDDGRSQKIGKEYGDRLNLKAQNLKSAESLAMLVRGYPSHSFVINRTEAAWLFNKVKPLDGILEKVIMELGDLATVPSDEPIIGMLNGDQNVEQAANDETETEIETASVGSDSETHENRKRRKTPTK